MTDSLKQEQVQITAEVFESENADPVEKVTEQPVTSVDGPSLDTFIETEETESNPDTIDVAVAKSGPIKVKKSQNTYLSENYSVPLKEVDPRREKIALPTTTVDELEEIVEKIPKINLGDSEEGREWVQTLNDGLKHLRLDNYGLERLEDPATEFTQGVPHESGKLKPVLQRSSVTGGATVSGEKAILGLRSRTGLGMIVKKPYWHTGIWLSVKSPHEPDLLELQRAVTASKVELGRHTWGLALSAVSGIVHETYYNLLIDNFYNTSAAEKEELLDLILLPDLSTMVWHLACAVYPNGFQYSRVCTANPQKCNHVSHELINPLKLIFVNNKALTQEQKNHMSNKASGSMDTESIRKYQKQMMSGQKREVKYKLSNGAEIKIVFKIPTLREYFNSTHRWVDRLSDRVIETLGVDSSLKDRNAYINKLSVSTMLRQYAHFVDSIDYGDIISDTETIESALDDLSTENDIVDNFSKDIRKYINDITISVIGVPDYECPVCKGLQSTAYSDDTPFKTTVLPIDPLTTFFTLHSQKLSRLG